jgi:DNA-directed RNA polymerase specialized sigma24 family protein
MNAFQKTEAMLWNYNSYKLAIKLDDSNIVAQKLVTNIDTAIASISSKYIELIPMHYFNGITMERIAEIFDISVVATYNQKKKLIKKLMVILCADEAIRELLS